MKRKTKLFLSLSALCLSIAMLCFGVYSAVQVSYSVGGSVSYEIQDVFVDINASVYRSLSEVPVNESQNADNSTTLTNAGASIPASYAQMTGEGYTNTYDGYNPQNGTVTNPGEENDSQTFNVSNLTYGAPDETEQTAYAFYIVIDILNYGTETINATVTNKTQVSTQNTYFSVPKGIDIGPHEAEEYTTGRLVIGLALKDVTDDASGSFSFEVVIGRVEGTVYPDKHNPI